MESAIDCQGTAVVSCDIVGHSRGSVAVQMERVFEINKIVRERIEASSKGAIVWSSGGDGGHIIFRQKPQEPQESREPQESQNWWQQSAIELMHDLYDWSERREVPLRIAGHFGDVTYIKGADGRVQPIGHGINYAGSLLTQGTWKGAVVSDTFRAEIEQADIALEVRFHDSRFIPNTSFPPQLLSLMSTKDMESSWGDPEPGDRAALDRAIATNSGWDILYFAKRIWQVNSTDSDAAFALEGVRVHTLRYHDARGSKKDEDHGTVNPFFERLGPDALKEVLQLGQLIERRRGDVICRYDETGDTMFVILRGEVGVYNSEGKGFNEATEPRHVLKQGEIVGELAYALSRNRTADLVALTDVALLSFNYDDIQSKSTGQQVAAQVSAYINYRILQHACDTAPYLLGPERKGPLAVGAPSWDYALTRLRRHSELIDVEHGVLDLTLDMLKRQEAKPRGLFILAAGEVREQRSGSKVLGGADFPLLWVEVPQLLQSSARTYEVHGEPVKVLHIAEQGVGKLQLAQRQALRRALPHAANRQTSEYKFDVFLCHSKKDSEVVRQIYRRLVAAGITCWFDERQLHPGAIITPKIEEGLRQSKFVLACISPHFADAKWAPQELRAILHVDMERRRKSDQSSVLVLMLNEHDDKDEVIPLLLRDTKRITYTRGHEFEDLIEYLTSARTE